MMEGYLEIETISTKKKRNDIQRRGCCVGKKTMNKK